jgi:DNA polymerase V
LSETQRIFAAIDLKSFYASVECVDRGLDPLTTNLVVADASRTEKTICLAVSPPLKAYRISGRPRLFEVVQRVREVNARRRINAPHRTFSSSSFDAAVLAANPALELSYITAPPRMSRYMAISSSIYGIYLKYIAPEDIVVYSIDEVFIDLTDYLSLYHMTARELTVTIIQDVLCTTGITATAGIGTNLYLAKVAMDIVAKRVPADKDGVHIAELDERRYRELLWAHEPLTDFWRVGRGYAKKLQEYGIFTMGDIARCSLGDSRNFYNEDLLYKLFGINAELLIDHSWGWEPTAIADIKAYKPESNSLGSGQVLHCPYDFEKAKLVVREMTDLLVLDLVDKGLAANQVVLTIGYDMENVSSGHYRGPVTIDHYGRKIPRHAHGTENLGKYSSSTREILDCVMALYDRITDKNLLVRRVTVYFNHVIPENAIPATCEFEQLDLFTDYAAVRETQKRKQAALEKEKKLQQATLSIKKKFGKNAILKGMNLQDGATARDRNAQVGGHRAGEDDVPTLLRKEENLHEQKHSQRSAPLR